MTRHHLPEDKMEVTWEDFANWILTLPEEIQSKQIWYIDIGALYKGRPIDFVASPTKAFIGLEELNDSEGAEFGEG
jgi:hypothetical protein